MDNAQPESVRQDGTPHCAPGSISTLSQPISPLAGEIHGLLAEANLLRIRKQYSEAITFCTRVLRLDPANATAHALMGDIHRDEGNYREALGWYKLATQLDPTNQADRKKLDEMIDRVFQGVQQGDPPDENEAVSAPAAQTSALRARIKSLLEHITPTHVVIGATLLAVVVSLAIYYPVLWNTGGRRATNRTLPTPSATQRKTTLPENARPRVTPPAPDPVESGKIPGLPVTVQPPTDDNSGSTPPPEAKSGSTTPPSAGVNHTTPSNVVQQVPPFEPQVKEGMSAADLDKQTSELRTALLAALKSSKLPSTLDDISIDPRTSIVTLQYTIPPMSGPLQTKQGLLYTGFQLVWSADKTNSTLKSYVLRGSAALDNGKTSSLALLADVSPKQADEAREAGDYRTVAKYLSNAWWRSDLATTPL